MVVVAGEHGAADVPLAESGPGCRDTVRTVARTVVIAPDSFKGTVSARVAAEALAAGWRDVAPNDRVRILPQADGGEGTLDVIAAAVPAAIRRAAAQVTGPDGRAVTVEWLQLPGGDAVVELAQCCGLPLMAVPDALGATTRGLGEVIAAALDAGAGRLTIALGGSASTDGGTGALAALGLRLRSAAGGDLPDGGGALRDLVAVDRDALRPAPQVGALLLTDVTAPLLGPRGAAAVFGPQKGASPAQVRMLDDGLARLATLLGGDPAAPGAGAAGGAAFGFAAVWGAGIVSGADHVAELTGLPAALAAADVVLTGEGRFDAQSLSGKVVGRILDTATASGASTNQASSRSPPALMLQRPRASAPWSPTALPAPGRA